MQRIKKTSIQSIIVLTAFILKFAQSIMYNKTKIKYENKKTKYAVLHYIKFCHFLHFFSFHVCRKGNHINFIQRYRMDKIKNENQTTTAK